MLAGSDPNAIDQSALQCVKETKKSRIERNIGVKKNTNKNKTEQSTRINVTKAVAPPTQR
jgi:hypothetical protein